MFDKKKARIKRSKPARARIKKLNVNRLTVYKTPKHMYAQLFTPHGDKVLVTASTVEKEFRTIKGTKQELAKEVGRLIAKRSLELGLTKVGFDRSGNKYHGRIKSLAEGAREAGMKF